jgi:hypothetical protein
VHFNGNTQFSIWHENNFPLGYHKNGVFFSKVTQKKWKLSRIKIISERSLEKIMRPSRNLKRLESIFLSPLCTFMAVVILHPVVTATVEQWEYRHMGCTTISQRTSEFLVTHSTFFYAPNAVADFFEI